MPKKLPGGAKPNHLTHKMGTLVKDELEKLIVKLEDGPSGPRHKWKAAGDGESKWTDERAAAHVSKVLGFNVTKANVFGLRSEYWGTMVNLGEDHGNYSALWAKIEHQTAVIDNMREVLSRLLDDVATMKKVVYKPVLMKPKAVTTDTTELASGISA